MSSRCKLDWTDSGSWCRQRSLQDKCRESVIPVRLLVGLAYVNPYLNGSLCLCHMMLLKTLVESTVSLDTSCDYFTIPGCGI